MFFRSLNRIYVEFIRAIPLLPMLFWVFYGLPVIFQSLGLKIQIDAFWGVITLAISDSAFTAEIYRAGIQSISKGQREAANNWINSISSHEVCYPTTSIKKNPTTIGKSIYLYS